MKRKPFAKRQIFLSLLGLWALLFLGHWYVSAQQSDSPNPPSLKNYVGDSSRLATDNMLMGRRRFEAGSRSHWHIHPEGQLLFVEEGRARVQRRGEPYKDLAKGDSDFTGPNVPHWHGATPDSHAVQVSISFGGIGPWLEPVSEEQYLGEQ